MKTYSVSINIEEIIPADDKDEALKIFWDDLIQMIGNEEKINVEEFEMMATPGCRVVRFCL